MTLKRLAASIAASGLIAAGGLAATAGPAQAVVTGIITICNSSASVDDIVAYTVFGPYEQKQIRIGACANFTDAYNGQGNRARVDVDISGHLGDVDSYWKIHEASDGTDLSKSCINGENGASDPWSGFNYDRTKYDTNKVLCP